MFLRVHGGEAAPRALAVFVGRLAVAMSHPAVAFPSSSIAGLMMTGGLAMVMGRRLVVEGRVPVMGRQAALTADLRHVLTVAAHRLAAPAAGFRRLFRIELVGVAALVAARPPLLAISRCPPGPSPRSHVHFSSPSFDTPSIELD